MIKNIIIAILVILVFLFGLLFFLTEREEIIDEMEEEDIEEVITDNDQEEEDEDEEKVERVDQKDLVTSFLGFPYQRAPLDEENNIYREDVFDSTTLVLVVASKYNYPENPEEGIKKIHYYPAGEVSYQNRLHFSSYRNQVSPYFSDITYAVGDQYVKIKSVNLNQKKDGSRLIDIDWEETIALDYILKEDVSKIIDNLPEVVGVSFIVLSDSEIGLDFRHEAFLIERERLIHASSKEEKIIEEDFLEFLENSGYSAVNFFEINE